MDETKNQDEGAIDVRFCITAIGDKDKITDFPPTKMLAPELSKRMKVGMEINLGLVKFKFG